MTLAPRARAASSRSSRTTREPARVNSSCGLRRAWARKLRASGPAFSSEAMRSTGRSGSPCNWPPRTWAMSAMRMVAVSGPFEAVMTSLRSLARVQGVDHLLGDVDTRTGEDDFLDDQVVLLGLEDLLDDLAGALADRGQLFVLALVQVLEQFAALALEVALLLGQFTLAARTLGLGQGRAVLFQLLEGRPQLGAGVVELGLALLELGLELGLGGLGRCGFAQDALAVDIADLEFLRLSGAQGTGQGRHGQQGFHERGHHQKAVPI